MLDAHTVGMTRFSPLPAALIFLGAGALHFLHPEPFRRVVPPWAGSPERAVVWSGVAELAGGAGLLLPRTRGAASLGLVLLLLAVTPVHVFMLQQPQRFRPIPVWALWLRLFVQAPLVWFAWRSGRQK